MKALRTSCIREAPCDTLSEKVHHTHWPRQDFPFDIVDFKRLQTATPVSKKTIHHCCTLHQCLTLPRIAAEM